MLLISYMTFATACFLSKMQLFAQKYRAKKSAARKTSPPVISLISSHKQAASGTLGVRDKERAIELHNPSPGHRQVSHDWLNKNTKSVGSLSQPSGTHGSAS